MCKQIKHLLLLLLCSASFAAPEPATQAKMKQLDAKINNLQQNLNTVQTKREGFQKQLANTETQIGAGIRTLRTMNGSIALKEQKIAALHAKINQLNQELNKQQQQLATHIRLRYQMGEYQALKWLIDQDNPYQYSRILTYYQYIVASRQQLIDKIEKTRLTLNENQQILNKDIAENKQLQHQLQHHQAELVKNKQQHTVLIQSLNNEIENKQKDLEEFKRNKRSLTRLVHSLAKSSVLQANKSFALMHRKLPLPVQTVHKSLRRMNQGVTFFADEGTEVAAVYPGKVVFSDWLKGYGLLLIIDHGQGFMTLYAHNQSLYKKKGQTVRQGEQIASVGHTGGIKQNGLYFEVRVKGKAISPFEWLS